MDNGTQEPGGNAGQMTGREIEPLPRRRGGRRRVAATAMVVLTLALGTFAVGLPAADAAPRIPPPMTNCVDSSCAALAGQAAVLDFLDSIGRDSGTEIVGVIGCQRIGNTCITRYFLVEVTVQDGVVTRFDSRVRWTTSENCGDIGVID